MDTNRLLQLYCCQNTLETRDVFKRALAWSQNKPLSVRQHAEMDAEARKHYTSHGADPPKYVIDFLEHERRTQLSFI